MARRACSLGLSVTIANVEERPGLCPRVLRRCPHLSARRLCKAGDPPPLRAAPPFSAEGQGFSSSLKPKPKGEEMETISNTHTPRIYVACLAAYNNGILHGAWIDADSEDEIRDGIADMLRRSPIPNAEEFAIHDYENFGEVRVSEYMGIDKVAELAVFIAEHGSLGSGVLAHFSGDLKEAQEALQDCYLGCFASLADYVQDMTEEITEIPEGLRYYIDWKALARDGEINGDWFTVETDYEEIHVFSGR